MADIVNLNFTADADFSPFIGEVNRAMAQLSKLRNTSLASNLNLNKKDFDAAILNFRDLVTASGHFSSEIVNVTSSTERFGRSLAKQNLKLKEYYQAYAEYRKQAGGQIRMLAQEQIRVSQSVVKSLGRDMSGAQKALVITPTGIDALANSAKIASQETMIFNKVLRDGATSLINWGKNTQWAGRQLTVGLTLPIMLFGKQASEAFRMADQELTRLAKVYGGIGGTSAAQLDQVKKSVSDLAKTLSSTYGASFQETLSLAADIAATGAEGNDLLAATAETTRLATLGEVDRQEAMKATLALQSAFKLNTEELTNSINFLNSVENQTSTTLQDLVEAIPKAGPVIKGLGGSVKDLALFLTAMREGGINAAEGANALKSGLASLINPTKQAVEKLGSFGINIENIVNSNAGNLVGLVMDLQKALDKLDPLQKQQAIEQLFGKYQFARIGALLNNIGREGSQSLQVLDLMKASTQDLATTADRELRLLTESASGRYKRALETFKASLAEFGEPFLAIFTNILKVGAGALDMFEKIPKPLKMLLTGLAGITAIIGPMIMLTGLMGNFIGYIIKGIAAFRQLRSGVGAFELISTATVAADQVADSYTQSTYNQAQAADVLRASLEKLAMAYRDIASAAAGGAPPPGGYPGGGMVPGGGPIVPTGGGTGGSAAVFATAATGVSELISSKSQSAAKIRKDLEKRLSGMSDAERVAFLKSQPGLLQDFVQQQGIGLNRESSQSMTYAAAALKEMGLYDPSTMTVSGMYKQGTGGEKFNLLTAEGAHLSPAQKKAHAAMVGNVPSQLAAGAIPMPKTMNERIGDMPNQENLMTNEALMAAYIQRALMEQEVASSGKSPFRKAGTAYKSVKKKFFGDIVTQATETPVTVPTAQAPAAAAQDLKVTRTKSGQIQVRGAGGKLVSQQSAEAKAAIAQFSESEKSTASIDKNLKSTEKGIRQSAKSAAKFAGIVGASVGTVGMLSSMIMGMTGTTNQMALNIANFATMAGYAVPAIQGLGAGLTGMGKSLAASGGLVGKIGQGLMKIGGPWGMVAIAGIVAITAAIKFMQKKHAEALAKAKADVDVSAKAVERFGGVALDASSRFDALQKSADALRSKMAGDKTDLLGLPSQKEIDAVKEDVKNLMQDQIKAAGGLNDKGAAVEFARNLKATLVSQGVGEAQANAILGSILQQAGKQQYMVPVMLEVKGISNKETAYEQLSIAAEKTFNSIRKNLNDGISIDEATRGRFASQISTLAGLAANQITKFEDIKTVVESLPDGMEKLNFQQLNATSSGRQLLEQLKAVNEPLYYALMNAESLGSAIAMAGANSLGLVSALQGVEASFDVAAQQAQKLVINEAFAASGIQAAYSKRIAAENNIIASIRKKGEAQKKAAEKARDAEDKIIDKLKKEVDLIKEQASERKDALRAQQEQANFETDINKMRLQQKAALMTGNLAEAAMIGLDIDKKIQDQSVNLAEKAIDEKAKAETKKREEEIAMHEERKKEIKDLTDAQIKAIDARVAKEVEGHQKTISSLREKYNKAAVEFSKLYTTAAQGIGKENKKAYDDLSKLIGGAGGNLGVLGSSFESFAQKATSDFKKFFVSTVKSLLGSKYQIDDNTGKIYENLAGGKRGKEVGDMGTGFLRAFGFIGGASGTGYYQPTSEFQKKEGLVNTTIMKFVDSAGKEYTRSLRDQVWDNTNLNELSSKAFAEETGKGSSFLGYVKPKMMGGKVNKSYMIKPRVNGGMTKYSSMPYLVGEVGPELFIPNVTGNIVPTNKLVNAVRTMNSGGSEGSNYYINVNVTSPGASADQIASAIENKMRLMNSRVGVSRTSGGNY